MAQAKPDKHHVWVGQRWYCDRSAKGEESFTFVILRGFNKPGEKVCRLEFDNPKTKGHNSVNLYSDEHIKKVAILVENPEPGA